ncbi:MAG: rod shape-determining protein MreC [Desulfobacterota bacterium]|nr:rod shape-determining protein MreC [Thermodesulfobacteriota bacterium]MDW8002809.1 rod shape-determining protein MreC [Deltaproteobacteria bacterium]
MKPYLALSSAIFALIVAFLGFTNFPWAANFYSKLRDPLSEITGWAVSFLDRPVKRVAHYYDRYLDLVDAKKEVIELRRRLDALYLEYSRLKELERENRQLRQILELKEKKEYKMVVASIVGEDIKSWYKGILIDKGRDSGIKEKMPVISPKGLVGQVIEANRKTSKIMVINDAKSAVDVYVEGKEIRGIVEGSGETTLKLKYVKKNEDLEAGDKLITSGKDGIYPRGIPVGIVVNINKKKGGIFLDVDVMPFANFRVLDYVIVLTG